MADYTYAYQGSGQDAARAVLKDAPISTKAAIELCNHLRGKRTDAAKAYLERVIKRQEALPFKRFTNGVGHKRGIAAGRYPEKASKAFIDLINMAEANASQQGLATDLLIKHLAAHLASRPFHFGRQRRRQTKRTHVEIVVVEAPGAKRKAKKATKTAQPPATKKEAPERPEEEAGTSRSATTTPAAAKEKPETAKEDAPGKQPTPKQAEQPKKAAKPKPEATKKTAGKDDKEQAAPTPGAKENAQP
ncbi:50S ribosomal protein L22 [Candidatus Woesearchaeota archaeon]|nr:50S ribosomal protein L22 [Candidatus Woesearchaeota archaeon]